MPVRRSRRPSSRRAPPKHRAEQRLLERAAERRDAQAEMERLHGEIEAVRAEANAEIAAARRAGQAAQDRAEHRLADPRPTGCRPPS